MEESETTVAHITSTTPRNHKNLEKKSILGHSSGKSTENQLVVRRQGASVQYKKSSLRRQAK